ncbi:EAL domain-containing protein [Pseudoalteromonas phenolica]|uniref:EAL domain-containing protein n=1 Tax=Pseudoalteromonas phenolica TaxID=161398 RepID=UPI00384F41CC
MFKRSIYSFFEVFFLYVVLGYLTLASIDSEPSMASIWYSNIVCGFILGTCKKEMRAQILIAIIIGSLTVDYGFSFYSFNESVSILVGDIAEVTSVAFIVKNLNRNLHTKKLEYQILVFLVLLLIPSLIGAFFAGLAALTLISEQNILKLICTWFVGSVLGGVITYPSLLLIKQQKTAYTFSKKQGIEIAVYGLISVLVQSCSFYFIQFPFVFVLSFLILIAIFSSYKIVAPIIFINGVSMVFFIAKVGVTAELNIESVTQVILTLSLTLLPPALISVGKYKIQYEAIKLGRIKDEMESIYTNTPSAMLSYKKNGDIITVSDKWLSLTGFERTEVVGEKINRFINYEGSWSESEISTISSKFEKNIYVETFTQDFYSSSSKATYSLLVCKDITNEVRLAESLKKEKDFLKSVLESITDGVICIDNKSRITLINKSAKKSLLLNNEKTKKINLKDTIKFTNYYTGESVDYLQENENWHQPLSASVQGIVDNIYQVKTVVLPLSGLGSKLLIVRDITESFLSEEISKFKSRHDALTGLPNEVKLEEDICNEKYSSLAMLKISNIDNITYQYGKKFSEKVLNILSKKLVLSGNENHTLYLLKTGEFAIRYQKSTKLNVIHLRSFLEELEAPLFVDSIKIKLIINIGFYDSINNEAHDVDVLSKVKLALNESEFSVKKGIVEYSIKLEHKFNKFEFINKQIDIALEEAKFFLLFQPIVCAHSSRILSIEALCRCNTTRGKIMSPNEFIPVAEKSGKIVDIGKFVIEETIKQISIWKSKSYENFTVSLNVSPLQLIERDFLTFTKETLENYDVEANRLIFEITESAFIENVDQTINTLDNLNKIGVKLALDDFGTGFSNLSYLNKLPIKYLKIDKSFVDDLPENSALAELIISIGKVLELEIISEGVETKAQVESLRDWGTNRFQGYYFSKPIDAIELERKLESNIAC